MLVFSILFEKDTGCRSLIVLFAMYKCKIYTIMGITNKITSNGFISTNVNENTPTTLVIEHMSNHSGSNFVTLKTNGEVQVTDSLAELVKFEYYDHSGSQTIQIDPTYVVLKCNGNLDHVTGGLSLWNTSTSVFAPTKLNLIYTLRLTGKTGPIAGGGQGTLHVDFSLSGAFEGGNKPPNLNRHYQGFERIFRAGVDHLDFSCVCDVFVDSQLITSGAQFYATNTSNSTIQIVSMSLFIKEN